jgi:2-keto-4-pentenoate hydratase
MAASNEDLAGALQEAERQASPIPPLSETRPSLSLEDAYEIQRLIVQHRRADGDQVVGWKIGLTSKPMQELLGVGEPDYGAVLSRTVLDHGASVPRSLLIQPRVEAEIGFLLAEPLAGPGVTPLDVARATSGVLPLIEVIDSRIADWRISLVDTIADLASSARFVLGHQLTPLAGLDLRLVGLVLERHGDVVATGSGGAVLGNPLRAVAWLANTLAAHGERLEAGQFVASGAVHAAVPVAAGDAFTATFDRLGSVGVSFGE